MGDFWLHVAGHKRCSNLSQRVFGFVRAVFLCLFLSIEGSLLAWAQWQQGIGWLHELTVVRLEEPGDKCSFCAAFQVLGKMTTLTRQDLNFGQGNVLCYATSCCACRISFWHVSLWDWCWRIVLALNFLKLGRRWNSCRKKKIFKNLLWIKKKYKIPSALQPSALLLFFSRCRCSFRISRGGCSPYLVRQRSLPYWHLSEEEKIQCTCPGRRVSWKMTAVQISKIPAVS